MAIASKQQRQAISYDHFNKLWQRKPGKQQRALPYLTPWTSWRNASCKKALPSAHQKSKPQCRGHQLSSLAP
eukprot:1141870-Pelagomonas_calceolata.AAC.3